MEASRDECGANGFGSFWHERYDGFHTSHAVPVTFERSDKAGFHEANYSNQTPEATAEVSLPAKLIIGGSNLIRATDGNLVKNRLRSCLEALKERGCRARVPLDANILHVLADGRDAAGKVLSAKLLSESPDNDRFVQYADNYPWLRGGGRLHKFMLMDGHLMIPDFGIDVIVDKSEQGG
ncbi:MAG: hypothetical protein ACI4RD_09680 [Kiritimatiellia bacterium]